MDRAILGELERLHNQVADIGALCNDADHGILNAHALRVREWLLRLNKQVTGHRPSTPAGPRRDPRGTVVRALPDPANGSPRRAME